MRITLLIAVLIAAIGCGASQGTAGSTPETELTITYWPDGRDAEESKQLDAPLQPRRRDDAAGDGDLRATARD